MQTLLRILATVVSAVAVLYLGVLLIGGLFTSAHLLPWIPPLASLMLSALVARFVWVHLGSPHPGLARWIGLGALITGGIGFSAGFFGPIIFTPSANQGPLLGIFITGPLGFLLGAVGGALYWIFRGKRAGAVVDDDSSA